MASSVTVEHAGEVSNIDLTENDLVICTNGCQGDASAYGDQTHAHVVTDKNVHITEDKKLTGTDTFPVFVA